MPTAPKQNKKVYQPRTTADISHDDVKRALRAIVTSLSGFKRLSFRQAANHGRETIRKRFHEEIQPVRDLSVVLILFFIFS